MGVDQSTRAYRRRLNVVANKFRRDNMVMGSSSQETAQPPPFAVRLIARTLMAIRAYWRTILFVLWLSIVGGIGALSHC
jgi:hypothetical protein